MAKHRDLVAEIEEIRARNIFSKHSIMIPFRMLMLVSAFEKTPNLDPEFLKYIPIGAVACFEGFFKAAIRECVDADDEFLVRASELSQIRELRLDFQILRAMQGHNITAGELIAHVLSLNSMTQINSIMSSVIGQDFVSMLKTVHSRWAVEVGKLPKKPIIEDSAQVFRHVEEMFKYRHIFAHELAEFEKDDRSELNARLESSVSFLDASSEVIRNILDPDAPLTQADINQQASTDCAEAEKAVEDVYVRLLDKLDEDRRSKLEESQRIWKLFQKQDAEFQASEHKGGSIAPAIFALAAKSIAEERLDHLRLIIKAYEDNS